MKIPSVKGDQETLCLPLDLIPGFLFGIEERRIKDEARREVVLRYKRECYGVLYRHFFDDPAEAEAVDYEQEATPALSSATMEELRLWLQIVHTAQRIGGAGAARQVWAQSPLPRFNDVGEVGVEEMSGGRMLSDNPSSIRSRRQYWRDKGLDEDAITRQINADRQRRWRVAHPEHDERKRQRARGLH